MNSGTTNGGAVIASYKQQPHINGMALDIINNHRKPNELAIQQILLLINNLPLSDREELSKRMNEQ